MPEKRKGPPKPSRSAAAPPRGGRSARQRPPEVSQSGGPGTAGFAFTPLNYSLFGAALAAIVVGYVLLGRGSVTAAPLLLVLGYLVLVPAALLAGLSGRRRGSDEPTDEE